ncbi:MAG: DUF4276 family protein [Candidatus Stygibacter frigidus]|nr:DUF4276 family protein [Candidatus Stygibacter frigidus]
MSSVVFFLEEDSAKAFLENFVPRNFSQNNEYIFITFEGKQDMEKQLPRKLRNWQRPDSLFVIFRDQDSGDCVKVKEELSNICIKAGKPDCLIRIACRELESWYLGDLVSVGTVYDIPNLGNHQRKRKFRNPDMLMNPDIELNSLTNGLYQKVSGSRQLGLLMSFASNNSYSFNNFVLGLNRLCT